jgi:hypothetical protein
MAKWVCESSPSKSYIWEGITDYASMAKGVFLKMLNRFRVYGFSPH